ncbi:hypothetical protein PF005_g23531 [Phytophthora fragariae]|uniref:Uncharacterized protein n=2 Tax=Phytophthora TaxID=4783 RepID=A0A6A3QBA9_9STRA|nr:hypothetical protein PF009_g24119 [Phytophthora fragariae]KAE9016915.1 hypothetical protein PR002_g13539 [Phytophthora rubi]KAE8974450.1 hypothetical protein PF011_g24858 [Phytophthora fragariae]KAE9072837.1 hypothetical protein PF007_g26031 [Phytophthora fragariae]KAE9079009.1 hypothetical protein PF010_g22922 [Phytophthora fragariae]
MLVRIVAYSCGLSSASGSSADTNLSMTLVRGLSSSARMTKMCAWGRPRFWNPTT